MRMTLILLILLAIAAGAAYVTRPGQGMHRGVAVALMGEGKVPAPDAASGRYAFEDFYVVTRSTMTSGDGQLLECWGVYTRFLCLGPAAQGEAGQGEAAATG